MWMVAAVGNRLAKGCCRCLSCISAFLVAAMALFMSLVAGSIRISTRLVDAALAPGLRIRAYVSSLRLPPDIFLVFAGLAAFLTGALLGQGVWWQGSYPA